MCPWPRIQAAMTDDEALGVLYRRDRGEPRAPYKKGDSWDNRGACIDCNQCVAACPMGIDIRDGAQLECINCALCIDACDDVMDRIGLAHGLIAYDTEANVERRLKGEKSRFRFVRPRTMFYAVIMLLVGAAITYGLMTRATMALDVLRDRNPEFVRLSDGSIRNGYTIKVMNRGDEARTLLLSLSGPRLRAVDVVGLDNMKAPYPIALEPDRVRMLRVIVTVAASDLKQGEEEQGLSFEVSDPKSAESTTTQSVFVSEQEE
jgi:cytochrome c oxidase accessory protein FixG